MSTTATDTPLVALARAAKRCRQAQHAALRHPKGRPMDPALRAASEAEEAYLGHQCNRLAVGYAVGKASAAVGALALLGRQMLSKQQAAWKGGGRDAMSEARDLEARFDRAVAAVLNPPVPTLFTQTEESQ